MNSEKIEILLVEDNPGDVELILLAFEESKLKNMVHVVTDGQMAIDYVFAQGAFRDRIEPKIIILDINLPKLDGHEVLQILKKDINYRRIPVIMLTTSSADRDILHAYDEYVNAYLNKPIDFGDFVEIVKKIEGFWFEIVRLPKSG